MEIFIILSIPAVEVNERIDKMKFTPEVIAALNTLKSAAENDFELHRINTLEQDLTTPPKVEIVDDKHQKFDGVTYVLVGDGYFRHQCSIHRAVYNYFYGGVSEKYHIHHIDENKANNDISNLQMLTITEHHKLHKPKGLQMACDNNLKTFTCRFCGKEFTTYNNGRNCYCSESCRLKGNYEHRKKEFICEWCGKKFLSPRNDVRFCSPSCRNLSRYNKN